MYHIPELDLSVLEPFHVAVERKLTETSHGKCARSRDSSFLPAGRKLLSCDGGSRFVSGHRIDVCLQAYDFLAR